MTASRSVTVKYYEYPQDHVLGKMASLPDTLIGSLKRQLVDHFQLGTSSNNLVLREYGSENHVYNDETSMSESKIVNGSCVRVQLIT